MHSPKYTLLDWRFKFLALYLEDAVFTVVFFDFLTWLYEVALNKLSLTWCPGDILDYNSHQPQPVQQGVVVVV